MSFELPSGMGERDCKPQHASNGEQQSRGKRKLMALLDVGQAPPHTASVQPTAAPSHSQLWLGASTSHHGHGGGFYRDTDFSRQAHNAAWHASRPEDQQTAEIRPEEHAGHAHLSDDTQTDVMGAIQAALARFPANAIDQQGLQRAPMALETHLQVCQAGVLQWPASKRSAA